MMSEIIKNEIDESELIDQASQNEGFTASESVIPFTRILQPLSPQLNSTPGASAGMLLNIATGRLTDGKKGMTIIPILHRWNYTEWTPREEGGGFVADWQTDEAGWQAKCEGEQKYAYKPMTRDGHVIIKARQFFIFSLFDDGTIESSVLPFTGTGLKIARQWSTIMQNAPKIKTSKGMMTPAYFYYLYDFKTEQVKNNQYSWYEPRIQLLKEHDKAVSIVDIPGGLEIWKQAIAFRDSFNAGTLIAASQADEHSSGTEDTF